MCSPWRMHNFSAVFVSFHVAASFSCWVQFGTLSLSGFSSCFIRFLSCESLHCGHIFSLLLFGLNSVIGLNIVPFLFFNLNSLTHREMFFIATFLSCPLRILLWWACFVSSSTSPISYSNSRWVLSNFYTHVLYRLTPILLFPQDCQAFFIRCATTYNLLRFKIDINELIIHTFPWIV